MQEEYLDIVCDADKLISANNRTISISDHDSKNTITPEIQDATGQTQATLRLKLPEASLPKFDGRYEQWLSFKDAFLAMVGDRRDLNKVTKLHQYLKACLTGDAARKISIFSITEDNYSRAWDLLQQSYQDERLIITRHLSLIKNRPTQTKESAVGLTRLADDTQQHIMSLQSLNVDVEKKIVVQLLVEKLHKTTRQKLKESLQRNAFSKLV